MKILYLHSDPTISGSSIALLNIIKVLKSNNTIEVFLPRTDLGMGEQLVKLNIKCISAPFGLSWYPRFKKTWILYKNIRPIVYFLRDRIHEKKAETLFEEEVKKFQPDIIHTNVGPLIFGYKIAYKYNIPHIWHLREYQDLDFGAHFFPTKKQFIKAISSKNTHNIAITEGIFNHFHLTEYKDRVIYDGVIDKSKHISYSLDSPIDEPYFLYVSGALSLKKGALDAAMAFLQFSEQHKGYKLVYVCRYYKRDYLFKKINELFKANNLEDKILFVGKKNSNEIYNLMQHAEAFLMLSSFEGFGFTTTEAMYNRCLVIGRNTAGTKEQFDNGLKLRHHEIGFRVNNIQDAVNVMGYIVGKLPKKEAMRMREDGYKVVSSLYTISRNVSLIEKAYIDVLSKNVIS